MGGKGPLLTLNNGVEMPALGLGVLRSTGEQTTGAVEAAVRSGYRLIDTAAAYLNETQVGAGIARSGVARSEMFVTTKLWVSDYGYDRALRSFDASLRKLDLDYLDLYLLHWPLPSDFPATIASYQVAERLLADGRVRAVGVSNFGAAHLNRLVAECDVVPAVNQVELHPFFTQEELSTEHRRLGVVTQAWSPIGGAYDRSRTILPAGAKSPLTHPVVVELAAKYGKTPAQVVLRWHIDQGRSAIPKSVRAERIAENIDIFDFALTKDDLERIASLHTGMRAGDDPETVDATTFDVVIEP
jgi:diketogulonate reductase-like aldo/keto reductase